MTYTIIDGRNAAQAVPVPMKGTFYDYSFIRTMPKQAMAVIQGATRPIDNIRRAVQRTANYQRNTKVVDNVLLVW